MAGIAENVESDDERVRIDGERRKERKGFAVNTVVAFSAALLLFFLFFSYISVCRSVTPRHTALICHNLSRSLSEMPARKLINSSLPPPSGALIFVSIVS